MDAETDYAGILREVSGKIKKRFTRKTYISQKSDQLSQLKFHLTRQEAKPYAAFFSLAVARCEQVLGNVPAEAEALTEAARLFMEAEEDLHSIGCTSCEEHMMNAIQSFNQAIEMRCGQKHLALAASLCLEVSHSLLELDHASQAIPFLDRATELLHDSPVDALLVMEASAHCRILTCDHSGALSTLTELAQLLSEEGVAQQVGQSQLLGPYEDLLSRCEVLRLLLLLFLQPLGVQLRPEHSQVLEKYTCWDPLDSSLPRTYTSEDVFLLLHSLVSCVQNGDASLAKEFQIQLWPHLSAEQNHVLHLAIEQMLHPAEEL